MQLNKIKQYREIIVYLIFGILTVLLNCVLYVTFYYCFGYEFANGTGNALANFICILFAYLTNRIAVFRSRSAGVNAIKEFVCFLLGRLGTLVLDTGIMVVAGNYIGMCYIVSEYQDEWGMAMKILSNFIVIVLNFVFSKLVVFKKNNN